MLLTRFVDNRDERAFQQVVEQHGAMVRGVARRVLGDSHEAEDIAQAAFLTLARKAGSLKRDRSVAGWLHRVTWRLALDVHKSRTRRLKREERAMQEQIADSVESEPDREAMREALDSAIERLPEKYRLPLVLFHLEGCPLAEVAARLRLNEGTAGSRISRAREKLRSVLVRRGVAVGSVAMLTSLLSAEAEAAGLSASFTATTAHAAVAVAGKAGLAGAVGVVSPQVVGLTEGAAKMIMISGIKSAAVVFTAGSLVVGTGVVTAQQVVTRASAAVEQSTEDHETELRKELLTVVKMGREGESTKAAGLLPGLYERAKAEDLKAEILYWQGWMHNEAGDRDAASRVLRQVVVIDPEGKWAKYAQGKLHTIVNQLDQIAKDEKAVRTSSSSTISLFGQSTNVVESADGKLRATITLSPAPASEE